jgi:hypothetical protein
MHARSQQHAGGVTAGSDTDLRGCWPTRSITLEGAEAIADIAKRAHLKDLNLYMNDIGDAGVLKVTPEPHALENMHAPAPSKGPWHPSAPKNIHAGMQACAVTLLHAPRHGHSAIAASSRGLWRIGE